MVSDMNRVDSQSLIQSEQKIEQALQKKIF